MIMEATSADSKWSMWKQDIFGPLFEHRGENELPTKEVASALVQGETFFYFIIRSNVFACFVLGIASSLLLLSTRLFPVFQCLLSAFS